MMKIATDPVDTQELQFKLQCRLKVFDSIGGNTTKNSSNLIAAASRFGLVFIGCNSPHLKVIRFASIEDCFSSSDCITNYSRRQVTLPSVPQYISVNCDNTILAVIIEKENCPVVLFYEVQSFVKQNLNTLIEVRLSTTPGVKTLEANWHPTIPTVFTECKTDGTLGVYELKGNSFDMNRLPSESNATCFCWSPKGKQIAVGSRDGKITHYKPDLKAVKVISNPPFEIPHSIISLQWISNYQFIGVFKPLDGSEEQCKIVSIDAPKIGNPTFTNFYDVCYSNGSFRFPQYYLMFEQHWNILMVASANSLEVGILAITGDSWTQWSLSDSARAELPLDENREETYPVGVAIDTSSVKPIPWGESSLPPAPSLLLLSHQGILCCFKIINLKEGAPSINCSPENMTDLSGLSSFTIEKPAIESPRVLPPATQQQATFSQVQQAFSTQQSEVQKNEKPVYSGFTITPVAKTPQISFQPHQVTITPVQKTPSVHTQIQTPNSGPATIASSLFGGQTTVIQSSTNQGSLPNSATSLIGSMLLSNLNTVKTLPVAASASTTSTTLVIPTPTQQFTSIGQSHTTHKAAPTQPKIVVPATIPQTTIKPQILGAPGPPASVQIKKPETESEENNEEIEKILEQMVNMERSALENELKLIIFEGKQLKITLNPRDMDAIVDQTKDLDDFIKELIEISESHSSEVHILKQNTIQSWAWFEEAKSRAGESQNEVLNAVLKSKPLDSVSEKHLITLKKLEYYLVSQLTQAHKALDEQWDKFQEYCRKVNRAQLPTMEAIFQTMVKQRAILQKQDYILKDISRQIKRKGKSMDHSPLFNSTRKNENLEDSFQNLKLGTDNIDQIYYQKVLNRVKPMSYEKSRQLRRILYNRKVLHVTVKSQVVNSVLQDTPKKSIKSILANMTPTTKQPEVVRNLNFYQSTPLNIPSEYPSRTNIPHSSLSAFAPTNIPTGKPAPTNIPTGKPQMSSNFPTFLAEIKQENIIVTTTPTNFNITNIIAPSTKSTTKTSDNQVKTIAASSNTAFKTTFSTPEGVPFGKQITLSTSTPLFAGSLQLPTSTSQTAQSSLPKLSNIDTEKPIALLKTIPAENMSSLNVQQNAVSLSTTSIFNKPVSILPTFSDSSITSSSSSTITLCKSVGETAINLTDKPASSIFSKTTAISSTIFPSQSVITNAPPKSTPSSAATNFSFFTPITSAQVPHSLPSTPQQTTISPLSAQTSAFTPIGSTPSSNSTPKTVSLPSATTALNLSSSIFGKPSTSSYTASSTSTTSLLGSSKISENDPQSENLNPSSTVNSSTNESSDNTKTSIFSTSTTPSTTQTEGSESSTTNSKTEFSFVGGSQKSAFSSSTTPSQPNIFGVSNAQQTPVVFGSAPSVFSSSVGTKPTTSSVFAVPSIAPSTAASTAGNSIFSVTPISSTSNAGGSLFGPSTTSTASPFSGLATTTCSSGSIFGNSGSTPTTGFSGSLFGGSGPATTKSIFGTVTTSSQNVFGPASESSPFASISAASSTSESTSAPFCLATTSAFSSASSTNPLFGSATQAASPTFGTPSFGASTNSSVSTFGSPTFGSAGTATSPFGATPTSTSPFGETPNLSTLLAATPASSNSPFATTSTSTTSPFGKPSVFGQPASFSSGFGITPATSAPIFGQTATSGASMFGSSTSSSIFGGTTTSSAFGAAATPFGTTSAPTPFGTTSAPTPFGTTSPTPFGTTASPTPFGTTSSPTPFGTTSAPLGTAPFGQTNTPGGLFGSSQSVFGSSGNAQGTASFGFGNLNVGTTTQSPFAKTTETKSPFGGSTFNTTASNGSLFGSSGFGNTNTGSIFGQSSFGSNPSFGSPQQQSGLFSGGSESVAQTGFGATASFQKPGGFGTQSSFGGSPAFGAAPTFGGAPAFGNTSPFGSPDKVFGAPSPTGVFGSGNQQSPSFGNLANQNTIGFGNLAQQSTNPGQNSGFSSGSSFSSWR